MKFKDIGLVNRKIVGPNGDFQTIKQAIDWFNQCSETTTEILLDSMVHIIDEPIVVNNPGHILILYGTSQDSVHICPSAEMSNHPLLEIYTDCLISYLHLDGSSLSEYGTMPGEDAIVFKNNHGLKSEIFDIQISNVYHAINDLSGVKMFVHDSDIHDCTFGLCINHTNPDIEASYVDVFNISFEDCGTCVALESAVSGKFEIEALQFINIYTACISYDGDHYRYGDIAAITNCVSDGSAPFIVGADFSAERDSDMVMENNVGYSSARPRSIAYFHATAPSYTTVTTAGTWYLIPVTMSGTYAIKTEYLANSRARYFTHEKRDTRHNVSGSLQQDGSIGRNIAIGLRKNGTEILAYTRVRCRETQEPYAFTFFAFSKDTAYDDYFELVVTSDFSGDPVAIIDLQWHIDSV